ncbi:MAG TPA: protein kinase [Gemmatimonadales bacterium]|nr:protein kinase [Gemmatimonadales bacterium]
MSDIVDRLAASLAGRYEIERELGAGGMATVYVARDLRHRRQVALKVMRPDLRGTLGAERFLREIELVAGLQHPHIVPVFDSGAEGAGGDKLLWYTMPLVDGESLRRRLQRERRLPIDEALTIAAQVADALAYAHGRGVVHRDIKPENILLGGGHAMVADFGIAKAAASDSDPDAPITQLGFVVGTPHYMSPEQASGGETIDARSDQYSLGCTIFEMLAGEPPFAGSAGKSVVAQSLTAPRPRVSERRPEVGASLDPALQRAMAVDPEARFPDMAALAAALKTGRGVAATRWVRRRAVLLGAFIAAVAAGAGAWIGTRFGRHTVEPAAENLAVLPFTTSGPGVGYLREGMVDLLSTNLTGVGGIRAVDPRTVLRDAPKSDHDAGGLDQAIRVGRRLGAGSVVLGSAVGTGDRVRLAADFYSIDGERLGRAQVDGPVDSVLTLVDRLSLALLRDVWRSREPLPAVRLASQTTDSIAALRAFLQGEQYYRRLAFDSAEQAYNRAVEVDSTFALAHFRRALTYGWTGGYGSAASLEASAAGTRFAQRLQPRERRLLVGYRLFDQGKPAAVDSFHSFLKEYPDDLDGWYLLGEALFHTREYTGAAPDTISAAFDRVVRGDSGLVPALIHPTELALVTGDSARFRRYVGVIERSAPERGRMWRTVSRSVWGPPPADSAVRALRGHDVGELIVGLYGLYADPAASSDTILQRFRWAIGAISPDQVSRAEALRETAKMYAGLGQLVRARALSDTVRAESPKDAPTLLGWPMALGLAPVDYDRGWLDTVVTGIPTGARHDYAAAMLHLIRGRPAEARRGLDALLSAGDTLDDQARGQAQAAQGYLMILAGDSAAGIRRMEEGIRLAAKPGFAQALGWDRFELALAQAGSGDDDTREAGIERLSNAFIQESLVRPLSYLALGRAYEAAGRRDSAAFAYGRFIRLWDKADPPLQGRVEEAREALKRLTGEPR